jgi:hypothetical protein
MSFDLASISNETRLRAPRIVVLGTEKIGKSTFAADSDDPIFISIIGEEGADEIKLPKFKHGQTVDQFPVCSSMDDFRSCFDTLWNDTHDFQSIVIDSASTLEPLIWNEVCQENKVSDIDEVGGGYNKGQIRAVKTWREITGMLDSFRNEKNMTSIIIGHVCVRRFDDPTSGSFDTYEFNIDKKAAAHLYQWADAILFCNRKTIIKKEDVGFGKDVKRAIDLAPDERFLYTQKRPAHPGGGRGSFGMLPYELPLKWGSWMEAVAAVQ